LFKQAQLGSYLRLYQQIQTLWVYLQIQKFCLKMQHLNNHQDSNTTTITGEDSIKDMVVAIIINISTEAINKIITTIWTMEWDKVWTWEEWTWEWIWEWWEDNKWDIEETIIEWIIHYIYLKWIIKDKGIKGIYYKSTFSIYNSND